MSTWTSLLQKPASLRGSENLEEWFELAVALGIARWQDEHAGVAGRAAG